MTWVAEFKMNDWFSMKCFFHASRLLDLIQFLRIEVQFNSLLIDRNWKKLRCFSYSYFEKLYCTFWERFTRNLKYTFFMEMHFLGMGKIENLNNYSYSATWQNFFFRLSKFFVRNKWGTVRQIRAEKNHRNLQAK